MMWLLDLVPWWLWLAGIATAAALTFPVWSTLWYGLSPTMKWAVAAAGGVLTAFLIGRGKGRQAEVDRQKQRDQLAENRRREIDDDVRKMDDPARARDLDKWMRDGE